MRQDLVKAAERATPYISRVEDLFQYGKKEKKLDVKAGLKVEEYQRCSERVFLFFRRSYSRSVPAPKWEALSDFLDQLERFLDQTKELYQEFQEAIENAYTGFYSSS